MWILPIISLFAWSSGPNLDSIFSQAKTQKKNVLVVVSAQWCPSCQDLEANVLSKPQVHKTLNQQALFAKIDSDDPKVRSFIDQHKVKGVPTLLWLSADQKELGRWMGVVSEKELLQLGKRFHTGDVESNLVAMKYETALQTLSPDWEAARPALSALVEKKPSADVEPLLMKIPFHPAWLNTLSEHLPSKAGQEHFVSWLHTLLKKPESEILKSGSSKIEVAILLGSSYKKMGHTKEAHDAFVQCVDLVKTPKIRSDFLNKAACLRELNEPKQAVALLEQARKKFPKEMAFVLSQARTLSLKTETWKQAQPLFEEAMNLAYGRQKLRVMNFALGASQKNQDGEWVKTFFSKHRTELEKESQDLARVQQFEHEIRPMIPATANQ